MGGFGKGKKKKNKGKSYRSRKKHHERSSLNIDQGQEQSGKGTEDYKDSDSKNDSDSEIDSGMLEEIIASMERLNINSAGASLDPQPTDPYSVREESSRNTFGLEILDFVKSLADCPDEVPFEDWLRTSSEDSKDDLMLDLFEQVENIRALVNEKREWAEKTVIRTAKRFSTDRMVLKELRMDKEETDSLLKQKEKLEGCRLRLNENESHLRSSKSELDFATQVIELLQAQNRENRAKIEAYQLGTSEFEKETLQAQKRETKHRKESNELEKQVSELRRQIEEERQNIKEMEQRLKNLNHVQEQAMVNPFPN